MKPDLPDMAIEDAARRALGLPPIERLAMPPAILPDAETQRENPCAGCEMEQRNLPQCQRGAAHCIYGMGNNHRGYWNGQLHKTARGRRKPDADGHEERT